MHCGGQIVRILGYNEGIAKLASRAKFDDFFVGSIFCKVTYPLGHRHFAKNRSQRKKHKFGSEWSFAIASNVSENKKPVKQNFTGKFLNPKDHLEFT